MKKVLTLISLQYYDDAKAGIASNSLSRLHIHSGNSWTKYNATYHRGLCNGGCGEFVLAQHYARTPGSNATCLGCGYVGNISIGLMSMGDKLS